MCKFDLEELLIGNGAVVFNGATCKWEMRAVLFDVDQAWDKGETEDVTVDYCPFCGVELPTSESEMEIYVAGL